MGAGGKSCRHQSSWMSAMTASCGADAIIERRPLSPVLVVRALHPQALIATPSKV
jgi:hypothetical protein